MGNGQLGWILLVLLALVMIIIGFQGDLGKTIAIVFCPKYIKIEGEF